MPPRAAGRADMAPDEVRPKQRFGYEWCLDDNETGVIRRYWAKWKVLCKAAQT